ncbi:hypothetical protein [Hoeflea poritis]|uniref:Uncharacterized protein n=1 Tax=Hoeflea poritis TaxID=2993659 RepID=A0ABT4VTN6_9HYPH|nr:hypothetical protein [Hoeflea poritis]MDA4847974.1 hypothetical protein [Hoeflea poritis]
MTTGNGDRSVKAGNAVGSQIITGDNNTAIMKGITVQWPQAENVSIADEIAALKADLASLRSPEQSKLERALEDASEEAGKAEPDKDEIGGAIERVIKYAKKADDLSSQAEKLAPRFAAIIAWLGPTWNKLAGMIGLGA